MSAYYNEIEPYAAQWLRNLIAKGLIADGEVDTRSIVDVQPVDLRGFTQCHFFAGIGGWSHALRLAGWPDDRPVWTGSCPCQPFSVAGKGAGIDDPRHLWPHFHRLISAVRPPVVLGEQVAGAAGYGWLDGVRADLEREGYASRGADLPALAVNAPHIRQRLYWVAVDKLANANDARFQGTERRRSAGAEGEPVGHPTKRDSGDLADASDNRQGRRAHSDPGRTEDERRRDDDLRGEHLGSGSSVRDMANSQSIGREERQRQDRQQNARSGSQGRVDAAGTDESHMADANVSGLRQRGGNHSPAGHGHPAAPEGRSGHWDDYIWAGGSDGKARRIEPCIPLLANGLSNRVGRLRAYGNAIVPPLAAEVIKAFMMGDDKWV